MKLVNVMVSLIEKFAQYLLSSEKRYVREQDLLNFCESKNQFVAIIKELRALFSKLGISLIRTTYGKDRYYVLTRPGKETDLSAELYGVLTLLLATYNELGKDITLDEIKQLFNQGWSYIEQLIEKGYLGIVERNSNKYLELTPVAKAIFKDVAKSLKLKDIFAEIEENEKEKEKED